MDDKRPVDLHLHTLYSDGDLTPETLVREALASGLAAVAVTDHDTVLGVEPVLSEARGSPIEVIAGVELSASLDSADIHILGYLIDLNNTALLRALEQFKQARYVRACEMVRKLREMDLPIRIDLVMEFAGDGTVGRPHVARALLEQNLIGTFEEAFIKYIGYRGPAYVPKYELEPAKAFSLIRQAGGVASLAHPATLRRDSLIPVFAAQGMEAVEVWHPRHSEGASRRYENLARQHGLVMTGGSDSHGGRTGLRNFGGGTAAYSSVRALREVADGRATKG